MMTPTCRGVILPVVLLILVLLGVLVAMFSFRVNADLASMQAVALRLQTRLAAEAGVDRVKMMLREDRFDMDRWYNNPDELHRVIVWMHDGGETVWGTNDEFEGDDNMAFRFSIVADDPTDDEDFIRFGLTDEASKINLNTAVESQLLTLVRRSVDGDPEIDPRAIVHAILDWRDPDRVTRGKAGDTEGEYYRRLPKPYKVKNGPFDTVEELLLVKGVTGRILYGEDFDRNGLLTPNEDDGDTSFPPDNEDGKLNRGIYPYLTVLSSENNVTNDNRRRVYLLGPEETLRQELALVFPDEPNVVDFIVVATRFGSKQAASGTSAETGDGRVERSGQDQPDSTASEDERAEEEVEEGETAATASGADGESEEAGATGAGERRGAPAGISPIRTPASLLREEKQTGQRIRWNNPLTLEHLPALMDRTTTVPPKQRTIAGLVNINTAPRLVLRALGGLTGEQIDGILEMRDRLGSEARSTTAWLLAEEVVDLDTFERIAPFITARAQQLTIEALGYADHVGMVTRLQVVVDMVGPIAQTIYFRDLSYLGGHYPIREEDLERIRAR